MSYVTPITDRTQLDVDDEEDKGYFQVSDWERIYENSLLVSGLLSIFTVSNVAFTLLTAPTTLTIPTVADFNIFLHNIERLRLAAVAGAVEVEGIDTEIKYDYEAGAAATVFNFEDVNLWENTIDLIWQAYEMDQWEVCPTLSADLNLTSGFGGIYIDCLDTADFNVDIGGTQNLWIL